MSKNRNSMVSVKQVGGRLWVQIEFPQQIRDADGNYRFGAFGVDIPTALYNAARHAFEKIHGKRE